MQPSFVGMQAAVSRPAIAVEGLPGAWTDQVAAAAWEHAIKEYPRECIGAVLDGVYVPMNNVAAQPGEHVALSPEDNLRLTGASVIVHSHPDGWQCPSKADMETQQKLGVPFVVLPISDRGPIGKAFAFPADDMQLLGRPFRHGVTDCYALVRAWFRQEWHLELAEFPRDWDWWHQYPPLDMYTAGYASQGFTDIQVAEATQKGDVLLMALRSKVPQHAAIVIDAQRILHHPASISEYDPTRLSCLDLRSIWIRFAVRAVRPPARAP